MKITVDLSDVTSTVIGHDQVFVTIEGLAVLILSFWSVDSNHKMILTALRLCNSHLLFLFSE